MNQPLCLAARLKRHLLLAIHLMSALALSANIQADTADAEELPKWYQVEVVVFGANNLYEEAREIWPSQLSLKYPKELILLKDQDSFETSNAIPNNPFIQQGEFSPLPDPSELFVEEPVETQNQDLEQAEIDEELQTTPNEPPFVLLGEEYESLGKFVNNITRQNDLRVLAHKTWRQPLPSREEASNILITGGEKFDQHYELEGFIRLYVSRYIHINTNLWFSSFISNVGEQNNPWPTLPPRPVEPSAQDQNRFTSFNEAFINPFSGMLDNNFSVDRTVTLQQSRRMRSNELHYIDHPLMGLVIRVTPYETINEESESEADLISQQ